MIDKDGDPVPIVINAIAARQLGFASPEQALGQVLQFKGVDNGAAAIITKPSVGGKRLALEILHDEKLHLTVRAARAAGRHP